MLCYAEMMTISQTVHGGTPVFAAFHSRLMVQVGLLIYVLHSLLGFHVFFPFTQSFFFFFFCSCFNYAPALDFLSSIISSTFSFSHLTPAFLSVSVLPKQRVSRWSFSSVNASGGGGGFIRVEDNLRHDFLLYDSKIFSHSSMI